MQSMPSSVDQLEGQIQKIVAERQGYIEALAHIDEVLSRYGIELKTKTRRGRPESTKPEAPPKRRGRPKGSKNKQKETPVSDSVQEVSHKRGRPKKRSSKRGRPEQDDTPPVPAPRKRGRPKGSKNKPKQPPINVAAIEAQIQDVQESQQPSPQPEVQSDPHEGLPTKRGRKTK